MKRFNIFVLKGGRVLIPWPGRSVANKSRVKEQEFQEWLNESEGERNKAA